MSYKASEHGALCHLCPLNGHKQVGPTLTACDTIVIGEGPGIQEEQKGETFTGPSGNALDNAASQANLGRFAKTNAIKCRAPGKGSTLNLLRSKLPEINERREAQGLPKLIDPVDACRPALLGEVSRYQYKLVLGTAAIEGLLNKKPAIADVHGYEIAPNVFASTHPARGLRQDAWLEAFNHAVHRLARHKRGERWNEPVWLQHPTEQDCLRFLQLAVTSKVVAYDTETTGFSPMQGSLLRTIQLAVRDNSGKYHVIVIWLRSKETGATLTLAPYVRDFLRNIFTDKNVIKIGQNSIYFDTPFIEAELGCTPAPQLDLLTLHTLTYAVEGMPHSLRFMGQQATMVHDWKGVKGEGWEAKDDYSLAKYGAFDAAVTLEIYYWLLPRMAQRGVNIGLMQCAAARPHLARQMRKKGVRIDVDLWAALRDTVDIQRKEARANLWAVTGEFAIGNKKELIARFRSLGIALTEKTETGQTKVDVDTLRRVIISKQAREEAKEACRQFRSYSKASKMLSSLNALSPDGAIIWPDGRVRPHYSFTKVFRFSSGGNCGPLPDLHSPLNMQNQSTQTYWEVPTYGKVNMKNLFIPSVGCKFVKSDWTALHLYLVAAEWQIPRLHRMIETGIYGHTDFAAMIFGKLMTEHVAWKDTLLGHYAPIKPPAGNPLRKVTDGAKIIQYNGIYAGGAESILASILKVEDSKGSPVHENYTLEGVEVLLHIWKQKEPELPKAWEREWQNFRRQGYAQESISGARAYFGKGETDILSAVCNWQILRKEVAIAFQTEQEMKRRGILQYVIGQEHDSYLMEIEADRSDWLAKELHESMLQTHPTLRGITLAAETGIYDRWE